MKKRIMLFLLVIMSLCAACSKEEIPDELYDGVVELLPTVVPDTTEIPSLTSTPIPTHTPVPTSTPTPKPLPTACQEMLEADLYSGKVQILDTVVTLPCKLREIEAIVGITFDASKLEHYDAIQDTFDAFSYNRMSLVMPNRGEVTISAENASSKSVISSELWVTEIFSENEWVFFPKGVSVGNNISCLRDWGDDYSKEESWGKPLYYYQDCKLEEETVLYDGSEYQVFFSKNSVIESIDFSAHVYAGESDLEKEVLSSYDEKEYTVCLPFWGGTDSGGWLKHGGEEYYITWGYHSYGLNEQESGWDILDSVQRRNDWGYIIDNCIEKMIVKQGDISTAIGIYDFSDFEGDDIPYYRNSIAVYADIYIQGLAEKTFYKTYSIMPSNGEPIPSEVKELFKEIMIRYAETVEPYE